MVLLIGKQLVLSAGDTQSLTGQSESGATQQALRNIHGFHETCHSVTFIISWKINSFSDISRECISPNMKANAVLRLLSALV